MRLSFTQVAADNSAMAMAAAAAPSSMGLASCVSIRNSSGSSSTVSPLPSLSIPPPSTSTQKPFSQEHRKKSTLADQLQPLSKEFLESPPPSRVWTAPTRRKARDSAPKERRRIPGGLPPGPGVSAVRDTLVLLEQAKDSDLSLAPLLDDDVSFLTSKDIVAILNAQTRWRRALLFFKWLKSKSFQINSYVYNVMLKILRKAEQWETGKALVEEMTRNGIPPDNITYSTIISFAIRCHQLDEALDWFSRMQDAGCPPDSVTYSAVIDVLAKSGRMQEAEDLCCKMQQEIQPCDAVAYSQVMKLHGMQKDYDQMWGVYKKMLAANMVPNVVTYNTLISLLGNAGRSMQVLRLFNDMLGHGLKPSPITLSLMFRTFAKTRNVDEAFELYKRIKKEGWIMDSVVYNTLLSLCAQLGKVDEGEEICKELLNSKVCRPDDWTWRTLVDMYVKGGKFEEARRITREMVSRGRSIDLPVYMGLIQGYGRKKDFKGVLELFDEVKAASVPFDHMLAGALLTVLVLCEEAGAEERVPLLESIGIVYPKLRNVVENLSKEGLSREEMKEDMRAMLSGASEDCRRPFCNLLMDLCWVKQSAYQAHELLAIAVSFGLYKDLQVRSPVEWSLKLRTLSFGAARTALQGWVSSLRAAVEESGELPHLLSIEVGMGIQFTPDQSFTVMSTFILTLLQEMKAPFQERKSGWLTADATDVKAWLLSSEGFKRSSVSLAV